MALPATALRRGKQDEKIVFVDALPPELRNQMTPSLWKTYSELSAQPLPDLHYKELEKMDFSASIDQVQALARTTLPSIPIVVLTKDRPFDLAVLAVPAGFGEKLDAAWGGVTAGASGIAGGSTQPAAISISPLIQTSRLLGRGLAPPSICPVGDAHDLSRHSPARCLDGL